MRSIDKASFDAGAAAYKRGVPVYDVVVKSITDQERAGEQGADWKAIEAESKSYVLGFASGVVEDIRILARGRGVRA